MVLHGARKQAHQAGAERSQDDADRRNGALMRRDPRLVRLLEAFCAVADDQREASSNSQSSPRLHLRYFRRWNDFWNFARKDQGPDRNGKGEQRDYYCG